MRSFSVLLLLSLLIFTTQSFAVTREKAWVDPLKAAKEIPDYSIQGEYKLSTRWLKMSAQVVALGDGKYKAVSLNGLPGEVSSLDNRIILEMGTHNGRVGGNARTVKIVKGGKAPRGSTIWIENDMIKIRFGLIKVVFNKVERKSPTLGEKAPKGATVLFDGTSTKKFEGGKMTPDGLIKAGCQSKQKFKSHKMHLEFRTPFMPQAEDTSRGDGTLGVKGSYAIQIPDTFGKVTPKGASGELQKVASPKMNACLPPLRWQTCDIDFTAPVFKDGKKVTNARITVLLNGVKIHDNVELPDLAGGSTRDKKFDGGPIFLQDNGTPVHFRNIWVLPK